MTITLNLYRIIFEASNLMKIISHRKYGFAFILAVSPESAKQKWITDSVESYRREYPSNQKMEIIISRWEDRWELTELIEGPFENGFVICNTANSEYEGKENAKD